MKFEIILSNTNQCAVDSNSITSYHKNQERTGKKREREKKGTIIDHMTERKKTPKPCEVLQRFFAKLNGSMKLLRSERPRIMF